MLQKPLLWQSLRRENICDRNCDCDTRNMYDISWTRKSNVSIFIVITLIDAIIITFQDSRHYEYQLQFKLHYNKITKILVQMFNSKIRSLCGVNDVADQV